VRVVFAEDNYLVREGTAALLASSEGVDLVATASDLGGLLSAVETERPDAVLTDIRMPPTNTTEGIDAARAIRARHPDVGVVVLSQYAEEDYAYELLKDGAAGLGYLLKERVGDVDAFVEAVARVAAGGSALDPEVVARMLGRRRAGGPLDSLSPRERDVLGAMAEGKSNQGIAQALVVTEAAVEKHVTSIFHKLGLGQTPTEHRRVLAVLTYLRGS
jgi:DNA-binding NarL/FixJ family response regulator